MSDRNQEGVRHLAKEILRLAGPTGHLNYPAQLVEAERILTAFQSERVSALQAQLHRALGEGAGLRGALQMLTRKLREIQGHPSFQGVFQMAQVHGMEYDGPSFGDDLDVAEAALTSAPLSERAGAVIGAAEALRDSGNPEVDEEIHDLLYEQDPELYSRVVAVLRAVDALQDELGKGGEGDA